MGAIMGIVLFGSIGVRLVATHRHSKDLSYLNRAFRPAAGPVQESPPWLPLTVGIVLLAFTLGIIFAPAGLNVIRLLTAKH